MVVET